MGETAEKAILRELSEELHISAKIIRPLWLNQAFYTEDVDKSKFHELCLYFLIDVSNSWISTDRQFFTSQEGAKVHRFEWLDIDKVQNEYIYPTFLKTEIKQLPEEFVLRKEVQDKVDKRGKITIRPTLEEDAETLIEIQKMAFRPLYEKYHDKGNPCLRDKSDITNRLKSVRFKYFTILDDDIIVGGIFYRTTGNGLFFTSLQPGEYYLQRIYVHPDRQGEHIAQTAIKLCEAELKDAKSFVVDFPIDMEINKRCYEAVGFQDTGNRLEIEPGMVLAFYVK